MAGENDLIGVCTQVIASVCVFLINAWSTTIRTCYVVLTLRSIVKYARNGKTKEVENTSQVIHAHVEWHEEDCNKHGTLRLWSYISCQDTIKVILTKKKNIESLVLSFLLQTNTNADFAFISLLCNSLF